MITLLIVGRRRPGSTLAEHRHHIRHIHGERVREYIEVDPHHAPRRYVQNTVQDATVRAGSPAHDPLALNRDFVTQISFDDIDSMVRSRQQPFYLEHLKHDEDRFVDQENVVMLNICERVLQAGEPCIQSPKLFAFVSRAPEIEPSDFRHAWARSHAALLASPLGKTITRHVQNDVLPGKSPTYDIEGVAEIWCTAEAPMPALLSWYRDWLEHELVKPGLARAHLQFLLWVEEDVIFAGDN